MLTSFWLGLLATFPLLIEPPAHAVLRSHAGPVSVLVFSQDGKTLAAYASPEAGRGEVTVWDLAAKKERLSIIVRGSTIGLSLEPNGKCLVTWDWLSPDGRFHLWDTRTGSKQSTFKHGESCWMAAFSPDGKTLASIGQDHVKVWDALNWAERFSIPIQTPVDYAFSPNSDVLAVCSPANRTVTLLDLVKGIEHASPEVDDALRRVQFSRTGRFMATASEKQGIRLWEMSTLKCVAGYPRTRQQAFLGMSPDDRTLVTRSLNGHLYFVDVQTGDSRDVVQNGDWHAVVFSPDHKGVILWNHGMTGEREYGITAEMYGRVTVLDLVTLTARTTIPYLKYLPLVISADGSVIARGERDGSIKLWFTKKLLERN